MKFRKKPIIIDAIEYLGNQNFNEVREFVGDTPLHRFAYERIAIDTLEGIMTVNVGDYIIKGVNGEFYPCKPDIFKKTYEGV